MKSARLITAIVAGVVCSFGMVEAQVAGSQKIQARHGDLILVQDTDQIRIVRRRNANVRAIFDPAQRWLVLLVDYASTGVGPDGRVDSTYRFHDVEGEWPLGQRWEGSAAIDDYSIAGEAGTRGIGFATSVGLVQILSFMDRRTFADQGAVTTLTFRGSTRGGRSGTFDDVENAEVVQASARGATPAIIGVPPPPPPYPQQPIRVGGNIRTPVKTRDVRPVYPPTAQAAGITGMVILETVIGADGDVSDVKVLKSIPELDAAAMEAVRQWRFEPTFLNGAPVPVIMTVTVNFSLQ